MTDVLNAQAVPLSQAATLFAQTPGFIQPIADAVAVALDGAIPATAVYNSTTGSIAFGTTTGGTLPVVGIVGITGVNLSVVGNLGGSGGTGTVNSGVLDLNLIVSQSLPPVSYQGTLAGLWNVASNSPSLGLNGAGGTAGQVLTVSVGGTTSITGTTLVAQTGDLFANVGGTAWIHQANAGAPSAVTTLAVGGNTTFLDDGSGVPGWEWRGNDGGVVMGLYASGVQAVAAQFNTLTAASATFTSLSAPISTVSDSQGNEILGINNSGTITVAGAQQIPSTNFEVANAAQEVIFSVDGGGNAHFAGTITAQGQTNTNTFSIYDIGKFDAANLAYAQAAVARGNGGGMATTSNINVVLHVGQSKVVGTDGNPPLSTTQPYDSLMMGQSVIGTPKLTTDPTYDVWTPAVDSLFHPAASVYQQGAGINGGLPSTAPTGHADNLQAVTVIAGGSNGTITLNAGSNPGVNLASFLSAGNGFQMSGFTVATNNNANPSNVNTFTVGSVSADQIICHEVPQATVSPENGITIAQANYQGYGENVAIAAINEYRRQQLKAMRVLTDPTRVNLVTAPGVAQWVASQMQQCAANYNIAPNPPMWNRISGCLSDVAAQAGTLGLTSSLTAIYVSAGGDESGSGVNQSQFRAMYSTWMQQIIAQAYTTFGATQTDPPFVYSFVVDGVQLNDGGLPNAYTLGNSYNQFQYCTNAGNIYVCSVAITTGTTAPTGTTTSADGTGMWQYLSAVPSTYDPAPTTMGILEAFGCSPQTGYAWQNAFSPNAYLVGPDYYTPDRGGHLASNGYSWYGYQIAKVRTKVEIFKQGWLPCHVIGVYSRGTQVLVCFSVPEPPLQIQQPYVYEQPTLYSQLGFAARDSTGNISVTSASLAGQTCVLLNLARAPNLSTLVLSYANSATYGGNGNICDSDTWVPLGEYQYAEGTSQLLTDNQTGAGIAKNSTPFPMWNWACPYQGPATAY